MSEKEDSLKPGDRVSLDVEWSNGRVSRMEGKLVCIRDDEAYVETDVGPVVGPAESLERVE